MALAVAWGQLQPTPDRLLIERLAAGDHAAHNELERRYWKTAYALAYALLLDSVAAERVVNDAFEVVRQAAPLGLQRGSFPVWLSHLVRTRVRARVRARREGARKPLEEAP